jgi:transcriptional regulator PpsR
LLREWNVSRREEIVWSRGADLIVPEGRFGDILAAAADIVIAIGADGVVQSILTNQGDQSLGCLDHWVGRDLREFLTEECHPKLDAALASASLGALAGPRNVELNHIDNASWEFPIRYSVFDTGGGGPILMVGRDLRPVAEVQQQLVKTQLELEKDYEAQREAETRFRELMGETRDALVFVDAKSGRIEDISEAAGVMLGVGTEALTGGAFFQEFEDRRRAEFLDSLNAAAASGAPPPRVATSRRNHTTVSIHSTLFRAAGRMMLLCRLEADVRSETVGEELGVNLRALYDRGFDAVVFTDSRGGIRGANEAFLNLLDVPSVAALAGKSISEFLVRGSVDLKILLEGAARSGRVRQFSTRLETAFGSQRPVDVSVTNLSERSDGTFGFVMRDTSRGETASAAGPATGDVSRNVMHLVGASPLKDIISATTDVIEKMCIETAVELTRNNRVAAAEMLGLSRQSLYVKLRKYDLLSKNGQD